MLRDDQLLKLLDLIKRRAPLFDVALVGGMAVVGHGVRRGTGDYDLLVDAGDFAEVQLAVQRLPDSEGNVPGLEDLGPLRVESSGARAPGAPDGLKNAITAFVDMDGRKLLDLLGVYYSYEEEGLRRAAAIPGMEPLKLLDVPYLVMMKMQANGPKDRFDIVELFRVSSDEKRVEILDVAKHYRKIKALTALLEAEGFLTEGG